MLHFFHSKNARSPSKKSRYNTHHAEELFLLLLILGLTKMYKWYNNNRLFPDISMFHGFSPWDGAASPCKIFFEWSPLPQLPATPGIPQTLGHWLFNAPLDQHVGEKFTPIPCLHNITFSIILLPFFCFLSAAELCRHLHLWLLE